MPIDVVWGTGSGRTELGAFDAALSDANVHNYNLVELSSIVPEGATVERVGALDSGRWTTGDLVAVVLASRTSSTPGERVAAGLGWALAEEGGVFVENDAPTAAACERLLDANLADARSIRDWHWTGESERQVVEGVVGDAGAGAAVVAAVFHPISGGYRDDNR
ncbi:pyruvoyl-dependent arginine decarboxylase [Haloplanus rubicundus]|uniref:arginine decarboxylase n=1 Tax=Haloplanus rubicundus TaxID=1547898 RepID=A0A345E5P1_9EURY|nr:pyruvoyl-dependent arginine decarboxylase [Haloplanus rubicundus]AXG07513.1 pyruvoyl-dependent arginine decarboxylase [Haloplanus rubicundus]